MSADNYKPTAGPVAFSGCAITDGTKDIARVYQPAGMSADEFMANGAFISAAFNVYTETGMTPRQLHGSLLQFVGCEAELRRQYRQLAELRDELLSHLRIMCGKFEGRMGDWENPEFHDEYNAAIAIIAKCEATKPDEQERTK
jgi:hypothetical protein